VGSEMCIRDRVMVAAQVECADDDRVSVAYVGQGRGARPAGGVERARRRNRKHKGGRSEKDENRFEQENRAFFGRVRHAYLAIAAREPQRVHVLNARGTPNETHAVIMELVRKKLKL